MEAVCFAETLICTCKYTRHYCGNHSLRKWLTHFKQRQDKQKELIKYVEILSGVTVEAKRLLTDQVAF